MNSVSGLSGFDPQIMMQKMQDKLQQADSDGNGALSKSELTDATEGAGRLESNLDRMFDKMDSNGDGELSQEEQAKLQEHMQERMAQLAEPPYRSLDYDMMS